MEVSNNDILVAVSALSKTLEEYHGTFREFRGQQEVKVKHLEDADKSDKFWGNVKTICVIPVITFGHQIAAHFGWIK